MKPLAILEMHVAHACNLGCAGCSHFSCDQHGGLVTLGEAEAWIMPWQGRVRPAIFGLLGGEPTLHPQLPEFIRLARRLWPQSILMLTTNGFFLDRHPQLPAVLEATRTVLRVTKHHGAAEYEAVFAGIIRLLRDWSARHRFTAEILFAQSRWTCRYLGQGAEALPIEDGLPRESWEHCPCKPCRQLFRGKLWKCSMLAYLHLQKETYPSLSGRWDRYLAYRPLSPDCTEDELDSFLAAEEETVCGMCSKCPPRFDKPSPLLSKAVGECQAFGA